MHGLLDGGAQADAVVADRRWCARRCFLDFGACTAAGRQHFACQMAARAGDFLGKPFDSCGRLGSVAVPKTSTSVSGVFAAGSQQLLHHKIDIHRRIGRYRTCPSIAIQHAC